jgi:hypothetical protein
MQSPCEFDDFDYVSVSRLFKIDTVQSKLLRISFSCHWYSKRVGPGTSYDDRNHGQAPAVDIPEKQSLGCSYGRDLFPISKAIVETWMIAISTLLLLPRLLSEDRVLSMCVLPYWRRQYSLLSRRDVYSPRSVSVMKQTSATIDNLQLRPYYRNASTHIFFT